MEKSVHVLYVLTKLELGGAQKVCLTLLNGLKKSGNQSFLITGTEGPLIKEVQEKDNVTFLKSFKREVSFLSIIQEIKTFFFTFQKYSEIAKKTS